MQYKNPWEQKQKMAEKALKHSQNIQQNYAKDIQKAIQETKIYENDLNIPSTAYYTEPCRIAILDADSLEGTIMLEDIGETDIMILNFASYKHPGGMFLKGSIAQEEALCHDSVLFEVLRNFQKDYYDINKKHLNRSLYEDRALFSKDVLFFRDGEHHFSVLTCAAPNIGSASKYQHVSIPENFSTLEKRIEFIFKIAIDNHVPNLVLGAWGCGVFRQDPRDVAYLFKKYALLYKYYFKNLVFAIPQSYNHDGSVMKNSNHSIFHHFVVNR